MNPARVVFRRYHFSLAGAAYALTTCVLLAGAINGQNNLLFWLFGLGVAGLLLSGVVSGASLMGLRIERDVPRRATEGEELYVTYTVSNRNRFIGAFGLVIEEVGDAKLAPGCQPGVDWKRVMTTPARHVDYIGPRTSVVVRVAVRAISRGEAVLGPMRVSSGFPLGLARKSVTFDAPDRVLIHPASIPIGDDPLVGAERSYATAHTRKPTRLGEEFFALREYESGDGPRMVAWKASARTDTLMVRTMTTPPGRKAWLVLHASEGEDVPHREDVVAGVAAGLARGWIAAGRQVGLKLPGGGVLVRTGATARHLTHLLDALAVWHGTNGAEGQVLGRGPAHDERQSRAVHVHAGGVIDPGGGIAINVQDAALERRSRLGSSLPEPKRQSLTSRVVGRVARAILGGSGGAGSDADSRAGSRSSSRTSSGGGV